MAELKTMTKLEYRRKTTPPRIESVCENIQQEVDLLAGRATGTLQRLQSIVKGNRAAIVAELGAENAKALQAVYGHAKALVEAARGVTIGNLPES